MASAPRLTLYHVHGFRSSRVFWLARELQRSYGIADTGGGTRKHPRFGIPELKILEFADADAFRAEKPAALLALNPNGKVPAALIEHPAPAGGGAAPPDVALFESGAIASFYLDTYDTEHLLLPPARTNERAVFNVLSHWCTGTIDNLTSNSSPIGRSSSNARSPNPPREEATTWHGARTLRTPRISLHRGWPNSWAWVGAMGATGTFVDQRSPLLMLCPWSGTLSLIRGSSTFCATLRMRRRRRWWRAWRTTRSFFAAAATFNTDVGGPRGKSVPRPVQRLDRLRVFAQHSPTFTTLHFSIRSQKSPQVPTLRVALLRPHQLSVYLAHHP